MAWNRADTSSQSAARKPASKSPSAVKGAIAGFAVVAILGVAAFFIFGGKDAKPKVEKVELKNPSMIKEVVPAKAAPAVEEKQEKPSKPQLEKWNGHEIASCSFTTNGQYVMITRIGVDGKTYREIKRKNRPVFDNTVDQMLSMILLNPPGASLPPMPAMGSNAGDVFAEALKKPITIKDDDDERVKKAKLLVQAAREDLLEELKRGKTVNQVLEECCAQINDNAKLHAEVRAEYNRLLDSGEKEMAEKYREKANEVLGQAGAVLVNERGSSIRQRRKVAE